MSISRLSVAAKNAVLTALKNQFDGGGAAGAVKVYAGTIPASVDTAVTTQVLLGTLTLSYPCATVSGGVLTFAPITQDNAADDNGTASWFRIFDSAGVAVYDGDISDTNGTGTMKLNTTDIRFGGPIQVNSAAISA